MCLAIPAKVVRIEGDRAEIEIGGVKREASLALVADAGVNVGDYVLVHTGYAIAKIREDEAEEILKAWKEVLAEG
ncbi:MAG: HypC/HybG/HupF family hydrogenase formation chaperone [Candidatus Methanomethylicia archaeon]|uniref:HypC/HybG/HupF family hydrogenase formation chaperone n=1 Tax=Thermoproteota archaeon TaxID=2056631 RepID=A0A523B8U4_9CREN|nr:HypC/HybG/HupF family hydrogenase formation chaperone [Candidatus Methanomethylicia archaeon]MCQ5374696.1 HypC/HybG/HupF family hydrogenase formation chaperone [Candidatus Methanomethylicia archaeon]NHV61175.1 HypC/HybG/HupF family hydrogenase formation chaperone [Candidatus Verstraetearchaeota archaeon]TDA37335.1 MAG: HypC/HybG/HupF family hydrogenase formation chaperone [Candidatus Verstraetearchaeota archaeon]